MPKPDVGAHGVKAHAMRPYGVDAKKRKEPDMRCKVLKSFANFEDGSPKTYSEGEIIELKKPEELIRAGLVEPVKKEAKEK